MSAPTTELEPIYPALAPPPPPARPRVLLVGTLLATAGMVMAFAGLIGAYVAQRALTEGPWLPDNVVIPLSPPNAAAATLVLSVFMIHWAQYSIRNDDRPNAYVALGITLALGLAYVNAAVYLYTVMTASPGASVPELLIYAVSGAHIAAAAAAIVFVALMAFRTLGGQYSGRDSEGISAAVVLWDAMVLVYLVIWYAIYITK